AELPRREEDFLGEARADDVGEPFDAVEAIAEPELRRRHTETGILGADTDVAAHGQPQPAADAIAADHGDGRLGKVGDRAVGSVDDHIVAVDRFLARTLLLEFGDVGAGHEGLAAGAGEDDDADLRVMHEIVENRGRRFPHVERDSVVPFRIVEDHVADAAFLARQHLVRLTHSSRPLVRSALRQTALAACSAAISSAAKPNSLSTSSVCWPWPGGGATTEKGVRDR